MEKTKIRISSMHLYYNEYNNEYRLTATIGTEEKAVTFKMGDKQTRKAIVPFIDAICEACAVSAEDLKNELLEDIAETA